MIKPLLHALATGLVLGFVGYGLAAMAGAYVETQSLRGDGMQGDAVRDSISSTLPYTLAAAGFLFVFLGEFMLCLWKKS